MRDPFIAQLLLEYRKENPFRLFVANNAYMQRARKHLQWGPTKFKYIERRERRKKKK